MVMIINESVIIERTITVEKENDNDLELPGYSESNPHKKKRLRMEVIENPANIGQVLSPLLKKMLPSAAGESLWLWRAYTAILLMNYMVVLLFGIYTIYGVICNLLVSNQLCLGVIGRVEIWWYWMMTFILVAILNFVAVDVGLKEERANRKRKGKPRELITVGNVDVEHGVNRVQVNKRFWKRELFGKVVLIGMCLVDAFILGWIDSSFTRYTYLSLNSVVQISLIHTFIEYNMIALFIIICSKYTSTTENRVVVVLAPPSVFDDVQVV